MSEELKPCPFCGGEAEIYNDGFGGNWAVRCACGAEVSGYIETEAEAVAAWNTRAERTCDECQFDAVPATDENMAKRGWVRERTCRNMGYYIDHTRFKCSECGYNGWVKWAKDGEDKVPCYCPNCGAKVVEE